MNYTAEDTGKAIHNYITAESAVTKAEELAEEALGKAYKALSNYKGEIKALVPYAGLKARSLYSYHAVAELWANDLDPELPARTLRSKVNNATRNGVGMEELRAIVAESSTVAEFCAKIERVTTAKIDAKVTAENSQEEGEEGEDKGKNKAKKTLLSVVLAALPNLTAEELSTVADSVAGLMAESSVTVTLANA